MFSNSIIETKVMTSSLVTGLGSIGIAVLNAVAGHSDLLGSLPALAQFMILAAIPPAVTFLTGYVSPTTARPDVFEYASSASSTSVAADSPPLQHPDYGDTSFQSYAYEQPNQVRRGR